MADAPDAGKPLALAKARRDSLLWARAQSLAERLPPARAGSRVAFRFEHDLDAFAVALAAAWCRGHTVALPCDPRRNAVAAVLGHRDTVAFVHDTAAGTGIRVHELPSAPPAAEPAPPRQWPTGDLIVGTPRPDLTLDERMCSGAELAGSAAAAIGTMALGPGDVMLRGFSAGHAPALVPGLLAPLLVGCPVHHLPATAAAEFAAALSALQPTVVLAPAHLLRALLRSDVPWLAPQRCRGFTVGEALDDGATEGLARLGLPVRALAPTVADPECARTVAAAFEHGASDAVAVRAGDRTFALMVGPDEAVASWRTAVSASAGRLAPPPCLGAVERLPRDADGGLPPGTVQHALGHLADGRPAQRTLQWRDETSGDGSMLAATTVPADYFAFEGHFVGYPVLSGAVQLHELVLPCLRRMLAAPFDVVDLVDVKFLARIGPGDPVTVRLTPVAGKHATEVQVRRGDVVCTTGRVGWRARGGVA